MVLKVPFASKIFVNFTLLYIIFKKYSRSCLMHIRDNLQILEMELTYFDKLYPYLNRCNVQI